MKSKTAQPLPVWPPRPDGPLRDQDSLFFRSRNASKRFFFKLLGQCLPYLFSLLLFQAPVFAEERVIEIITLQNRPAEEIQALVTPMLEADDVINSNGFELIVKTYPERLESLRNLIQQLDGRLHNLIISVLQNSHKSAEQLNAEAGLIISSTGIRMQGMAGDTRDSDSQRTTQQLRTLEGQAAHIQIGALRQVDNVTLYDSGYGYPAVMSQTQLQEASTGFAVIPRLSGNQEVMIDIAPWSDRFLSSGGLATQSIQTSVRARLGEWVELGGVATQRQSDKHGFQGLNHSTRNDDLHVLIKVDLAD